jgi:hypothetical protein
MLSCAILHVPECSEVALVKFERAADGGEAREDAGQGFGKRP